MEAPHTTSATLYKTAAALIGLLVLTVGLAYLDMGPLNLVVALVIAVAKALLVIWIFMEVRASSRLVWIMAGAGVFWLMLLLTGTLADYMTRSPLVVSPRAPMIRLTAGPLLKNSNAADSQNAGNIGPAGGWAKSRVPSNAKAGTPGEPINRE